MQIIYEIADVNPALSPDQIVCIANVLTANDLEPECEAAVNTILIYINSESPLITSIANDPSPLSTFCTSKCGLKVIDIISSCGAYDDIRAEVDFVVGLCDINSGTPCYTQTNALLYELDDTAYCGVRANGVSCPLSCPAIYQSAADELGCCYQVLITYVDAIFHDVELDDFTEDAFQLCGVKRPRQCTTSALSLPTPKHCGTASYVPSLYLLAVAAMGSAISCLLQ